MKKVLCILIFFAAFNIIGKAQGYFMMTPPAVRTDTNATNILTLNTAISPAEIQVMSAATIKAYFNKNSQLYYNGTLVPNAIYFVGTASSTSGSATIWITDNGTSTGNAVYTTVMNVIPFINDNSGNFNYQYTVAGDLKSITVAANKSTSTYISLLGLNLLGAPAAVANGTSIRFMVVGN